jgi:Family of unknown function (DUF6627)
MSKLLRPLAWLLSLLLAITPVFTAQAAMIGTDALLNQAHSGQTRDSLQHLLGQQAAQQQLAAMGVDPAWLKERTSRLTDDELARINQGIDRMDAAGDGVLGVLLVIFIIFVITDVIGATNIFPFIHPVH